MTSGLRVAYRVWAAALFLAVVVQIALAGYGAFYAAKKTSGDHDVMTHAQFDHGFSAHDGLGYLIFVGSVVLLALALGARLGRSAVLMALATAVLVVVQIALALAGESVPAIGVLHPLNAFVIAGITGRIAHLAWRREAAP